MSPSARTSAKGPGHSLNRRALDQHVCKVTVAALTHPCLCLQISTLLSSVAEVNMLISTRRTKLVSSWWTQHAHRRPPTSGIGCDLHR